MIISLSGKISSGKSLTSKIIQYYIAGSKDSSVFKTPIEYWDDNCEKLSKLSGFELKSFAHKIKLLVSVLINCEVSDLEDKKFKETTLGPEWNVSIDMFEAEAFARDGELTPRKLMQLLGTDCGRDIIHPNIWINALFSDYKKVNGKYPNWIVTDSRFINDNERLKEYKALRIRIERPNILTNDGINNHSSETALDNVTDFDEVIINDKSIPDLMLKVKNILINHSII